MFDQYTVRGHSESENFFKTRLCVFLTVDKTNQMLNSFMDTPPHSVSSSEMYGLILKKNQISSIPSRTIKGNEEKEEEEACRQGQRSSDKGRRGRGCRCHRLERTWWPQGSRPVFCFWGVGGWLCVSGAVWWGVHTHIHTHTSI